MSISLTQPPALSEPPDEALVRRLLAGETSAGETLARRYHVSLSKYLHRLAGNEHQAEELLQATWLSVLEHLEKFDAGSTAGGFKAWLFRIATNKANDAWRSRGRERTAKDGLKLVIEAEAPGAAHALEGAEQRGWLMRAIDQLPEAQKQVLLMRYYGEMKFVEIAEMLGCPLSTALGRMHKAMLRLKQLLEADDRSGS